MKILIASLFTLSAFASEPAKKQEPIKIVGPGRHIANFDQTTGKLTPVKGVDPQEIYQSLVAIIQNTEAKLAECEKKNQLKKD